MLKCNNKRIASEIVFCDSALRQGTGLMFRTRSAVRDKAWIFRFKTPRTVNITMLFVFYPIDILFLDNDNKIIGLVKGLKPFGWHECNAKISSFIELDSGTIARYGIKKGQHINITSM